MCCNTPVIAQIGTSVEIPGDGSQPKIPEGHMLFALARWNGGGVLKSINVTSLSDYKRKFKEDGGNFFDLVLVSKKQVQGLRIGEPVGMTVKDYGRLRAKTKTDVRFQVQPCLG